jgi:hypothetical protein
MVSDRPLADLRTERTEPFRSIAPRRSLRLHGVPVPSRALGFAAWLSAPRPEPAATVQLYRLDARSRGAAPATSHAA